MIVPITVRFISSFHKPIINKIPPIDCKIVKIKIGILWCFGTGVFFLLAQNFSPSTDLDPQFSKFLGFLNSVGFMISQIMRMLIGIKLYQPIHTLDQIAKTKKGKVANLVQIDQGLACLIQLSPSVKF